MARYLDDGEGALVNQPANQVATIAAVAATGATSSTPFGYTEAQANAIVSNLNNIRLALIAAGIMKSA